MAQISSSHHQAASNAVGTIISNGILSNPKNWSRINPTPLNPNTLTDLFALLKQRQADYLLVGGIAMLNYVEGRNTQDIDFLMSPADLANIPELVIASQDQNRTQPMGMGYR